MLLMHSPSSSGSVSDALYENADIMGFLMLIILQSLMRTIQTRFITPCAIQPARSFLRSLGTWESSMLTCPQPVIDYDLSRQYPEVWRAMELLVDAGKTKSIGQPRASRSIKYPSDMCSSCRLVQLQRSKDQAYTRCRQDPAGSEPG